MKEINLNAAVYLGAGNDSIYFELYQRMQQGACQINVPIH